jgi:hypothetical protein
MNQRILEYLLRNMRYIRHAAVHRKPTPIATLRRMLADAQQLTTGLREASRGNRLKAIAMALESGDLKNIQDIMVAPAAAFSEGQRMRTLKPAPGQFQCTLILWNNVLTAQSRLISQAMMKMATRLMVALMKAMLPLLRLSQRRGISLT